MALFRKNTAKDRLADVEAKLKDARHRKAVAEAGKVKLAHDALFDDQAKQTYDQHCAAIAQAYNDIALYEAGLPQAQRERDEEIQREHTEARKRENERRAAELEGLTLRAQAIVDALKPLSKAVRDYNQFNLKCNPRRNAAADVRQELKRVGLIDRKVNALGEEFRDAAPTFGPVVNAWHSPEYVAEQNKLLRQQFVPTRIDHLGWVVQQWVREQQAELRGQTIEPDDLSDILAEAQQAQQAQQFPRLARFDTPPEHSRLTPLKTYRPVMRLDAKGKAVLDDYGAPIFDPVPVEPSEPAIPVTPKLPPEPAPTDAPKTRPLSEVQAQMSRPATKLLFRNGKEITA
jgi:hypothetical protein